MYLYNVHVHVLLNVLFNVPYRIACTGVHVSLFNLSSFQDPATKYHGHLLLAHIIAKFAIHKRIVLQVCMQCYVISPPLSNLFSLSVSMYTVHVHVFPLMPILGVPQSP